MAIVQGRHLDPKAGVQRFETDVVVIGSGAGGGPFAAELAEAGLDVILVEEGGWYRTEDFTTDAIKMVKKLYRNAGTTMAMAKPNVNMMEGRCVGGSTVINAGISWRTPDRILKTWKWEHQLDDVDPKTMAPFFDRVERRVHVAPQAEDTYGGDAAVFKERSEEHTSELQSRPHLVCRLLLEKKKTKPQKTVQPPATSNTTTNTQNYHNATSTEQA